MGCEVKSPERPLRIISLVPSQTELLFELGLDVEIVGLTKFCIHPNESVKQKTVIGGTKNFRFDVIDKLKPDLIIGNKEENYESGINRLKERYPVWMSDISTLDKAYDMMINLGEVVNRQERAKQLVSKISQSFSELQDFEKVNALYFIWDNPKMIAGRNTFIDQMLKLCAFNNLAINSRYPEITDLEIESLKPDVILLSSEPFPFNEKHIQSYEKRFQAKVILVDGELFSWYGSRLLRSAAYFKHLRSRLAAPS